MRRNFFRRVTLKQKIEREREKEAKKKEEMIKRERRFKSRISMINKKKTNSFSLFRLSCKKRLERLRRFERDRGREGEELVDLFLFSC